MTVSQLLGGRLGCGQVPHPAVPMCTCVGHTGSGYLHALDCTTAARLQLLSLLCTDNHLRLLINIRKGRPAHHVTVNPSLLAAAHPPNMPGLRQSSPHHRLAM